MNEIVSTFKKNAAGFLEEIPEIHKKSIASAFFLRFSYVIFCRRIVIFIYRFETTRKYCNGNLLVVPTEVQIQSREDFFI